MRRTCVSFCEEGVDSGDALVRIVLLRGLREKVPRRPTASGDLPRAQPSRAGASERSRLDHPEEGSVHGSMVSGLPSFITSSRAEAKRAEWIHPRIRCTMKKKISAVMPAAMKRRMRRLSASSGGSTILSTGAIDGVAFSTLKQVGRFFTRARVFVGHRASLPDDVRPWPHIVASIGAGAQVYGLEEKRDDRAPVFWVVAEVLPVQAMIGKRTWNEVRGREPGEHPGRNGPCGERKSDPFDDFTEVVGAREPPVESALGDLVAAFPRLSEAQKDCVGLLVDGVTSREDDDSGR